LNLKHCKEFFVNPYTMLFKIKKTLPINITLCYYENMKGMFDNWTTDLKTTKYVSFEIDGTRYYKIII